MENAMTGHKKKHHEKVHIVLGAKVPGIMAVLGVTIVAVHQLVHQPVVV